MDPALQTCPSRWRACLRSASASLKLRITLCAIAALILGIGLTTTALLQRAERDTLILQNDRELNEAVRGASILSRRVVALQRALQVVAEQLGRQTLADDARLGTFVESKPVLRELFSSLSVADAAGDMRIFADEAGLRHPAFNVADRPYFRRTLREQRPVVSDALPSRLTGQSVIILAVPLRDALGPYGMLAGALRLASRDLLTDLVDAQTNESDDVLLVATDARGQIIAHPDRNRLLQNLASEPRLSEAFRHWVDAGAPMEPSGLRLQQHGEVVSVAGIAGPDWMVWRVVPEAGLLAPLRAARQRAFVWAAGLTAFTCAAMLILLHLLLRPLTQLEHRAQHLFNAGADLHGGWPEGAGEIGRLARVLRHVGAERAQLEEFNASVLGKLGSVMAAAPVGIAFTRLQRFELVSAEFCRLFGREDHELLGQSVEMTFNAATEHRRFTDEATLALQAGEAYVGEWQMRRADGSVFWARLRGRSVDAGDADAGTIWTLNDIDQQIASRSQLEWSATHDALTGLANRAAFEQRLEGVFGGLPRTLHAAVVAIDLDHFKPINDTAGHAAGDAVLKAVAAAITSHVRSSDLVGRLGGDEFALLLEGCSHDVALRIADNVRGAISAISVPWGHRLLSVGASLGVASLAEHTLSIGAWIAEADAACYAAKAGGRGTVRSAASPAPQSADPGPSLVEHS